MKKTRIFYAWLFISIVLTFVTILVPEPSLSYAAEGDCCNTDSQCDVAANEKCNGPQDISCVRNSGLFKTCRLPTPTPTSDPTSTCPTDYPEEYCQTARPDSGKVCVTKGRCYGGGTILRWCCHAAPPTGTPIPVYDPKCYGRFGEGVKSGLGCLPTDPQAFINTVTPWAIGIGSGIAFLLGLYGALMIVISAGDPEKMQAGKEIITSAVAGLLLIVFAVFILRIIGVDVLKLF